MINYKPLVVEKIKEFGSKFPEYSIGEILYSTFGILKAGEDLKTSNLLKIKDSTFYTALEMAMKREEE